MPNSGRGDKHSLTNQETYHDQCIFHGATVSFFRGFRSL